LAEHFNQSLVIRDIGTGAVGEEGKAQGIDCQMSLDAVGRFVSTKSFGGNAGIAGVLDRLGVNQDQRRPFRLFFTCSRTLA